MRGRAATHEQNVGCTRSRHRTVSRWREKAAARARSDGASPPPVAGRRAHHRASSTHHGQSPSTKRGWIQGPESEQTARPSQRRDIGGRWPASNPATRQ
eukprot:5942193-Prymnesium_polylepis.5